MHSFAPYTFTQSLIAHYYRYLILKKMNKRLTDSYQYIYNTNIHNKPIKTENIPSYISENGI